jgi:hypothetical protein
MEDIKIAVTKFEQFIDKTDEHIWYGILKRRFAKIKHTRAEWFDIINSIKNEPAYTHKG